MSVVFKSAPYTSKHQRCKEKKKMTNFHPSLDRRSLRRKYPHSWNPYKHSVMVFRSMVKDLKNDISFGDWAKVMGKCWGSLPQHTRLHFYEFNIDGNHFSLRIENEDAERIYESNV
jgi:hypothetical protein